jgi:hypothetical protein
MRWESFSLLPLLAAWSTLFASEGFICPFFFLDGKPDITHQWHETESSSLMCACGRSLNETMWSAVRYCVVLPGGCWLVAS